ncbi:MAG: stage II sporulation protein M, partial [Bacteroidia bacterium]
MKETRFIEQKKDSWQELESLLSEKNANPDRLSELFVQVTDDLSYARTYYGNRVVRVFLNQLTQRLF